MKVLVACEESQVVTIAFREKGHFAFSADIQYCSGGYPQFHIKGDVRPLLNGNCKIVTCTGDTFYIDRWDLLIAHPPCTYLALSGACNLLNKDHTIKDYDRYQKMLLAREFFFACLNADCDKICVENPKPMRIAGLPPKSMVLQPWEFGEPYTKRTYLWLKNLPPLMPICAGFDYELEQWCKIHSSAKIRSKTFPNVALEMARQWG